MKDKIINCNCKVESEDEKLRLLIKSFYKDKTYAGWVEVSEKDMNKEYVERQGSGLVKATIRALLKNKIILG